MDTRKPRLPVKTERPTATYTPPMRRAEPPRIRLDVCPRCHVVHSNPASWRLCAETRHLL